MHIVHRLSGMSLMAAATAVFAVGAAFAVRAADAVGTGPLFPDDVPHGDGQNDHDDSQNNVIHYAVTLPFWLLRVYS